MLFAGLDREHGGALADLDEVEAEKGGDGRRRDLPGGHPAKRGEAADRGKAAGGPAWILSRRGHAAWRRGAGSGGRGRMGLGSWAGVIAASQGKSASMVTSGPGMSCGVIFSAFVQGCVKKLSLRQRVA